MITCIKILLKGYRLSFTASCPRNPPNNGQRKLRASRDGFSRLGELVLHDVTLISIAIIHLILDEYKQLLGGQLLNSVSTAERDICNKDKSKLEVRSLFHILALSSYMTDSRSRTLRIVDPVDLADLGFLDNKKNVRRPQFSLHNAPPEHYNENPVSMTSYG